MKKNTLQLVFTYLIVAVGIGAIVITFSLLVNYGMNDILKQLAVWLIASAVIGLASMVYENVSLSHLTATLIHAPITALVALCSGWILGYGDGSLTLLLMRMLPTIVVIYAVIHLILFLFRRAALSDLNSRLQEK